MNLCQPSSLWLIFSQLYCLSLFSSSAKLQQILELNILFIQFLKLANMLITSVETFDEFDDGYLFYSKISSTNPGLGWEHFFFGGISSLYLIANTEEMVN